MAIKSLRERKKEKTRKTLIRISTRLFLKNGFDKTTVDDIVEVAEISRSTFFRYFPTKDAIVFPQEIEQLELFKDIVGKFRKNNAPYEAIKLGLIEIARDFMSRKKEMINQQKIIESSHYLMSRQFEYDSEWETIITETLINEKTSDKEMKLKSRLFSGAVFGIIQVILREWYESGCEIDLAKLGDEAWSF